MHRQMRKPWKRDVFTLILGLTSNPVDRLGACKGRNPGWSCVQGNKFFFFQYLIIQKWNISQGMKWLIFFIPSHWLQYIVFSNSFEIQKTDTLWKSRIFTIHISAIKFCSFVVVWQVWLASILDLPLSHFLVPWFQEQNIGPLVRVSLSTSIFSCTCFLSEGKLHIMSVVSGEILLKELFFFQD